MGAEQILIKLHENNILEIANVIGYCFRWLGWTIIKILASIVNGIEVVVNKIYTLNDFFNSDLVNEFINKYKPLIWTILAISIVILGYRIIFNKNSNREHLPSNIIFSVLIIILLPTFMIKLNEITQLGIEDVKGYTKSANELIKNNLFDMHFLDKNNFDFNRQKNNLKEDKILNIEINEKVDDSKVSTKNIFDKKITMNDNGEIEVVNLEKGWFKLDEEYYRYNIDFIIVIISLGATGITLLCVALKVARLLFELAFNKLFATLFAFADIDDGKKIREIFKNILSIFAVLFATAIMVKLYVIFTVWLGSKMGNIEVGLGFSAENLAKVIVQIGASIAVIDGPNIIEKILGIDAGLRGGFGTVMSAYGVAKGLGLSRKTISSGGKLVGKAAAASANIGAGILGAMVGLGKGKTSLSQEQDNFKNNSNIKDNNLQNEMNKSKTNSSSNTNNSAMKENKNTDNKQNMNINNDEIESLNLKDNKSNALQNQMNNKDLNSINGDKDLRLDDEVTGKNNSQLRECDNFNKSNSLYDGKECKNSDLDCEMEKQELNSFNPNNNKNIDDNENSIAYVNDKGNNGRSLDSEIESPNKEFLNDLNGYKSNSLNDQMKKQDNSSFEGIKNKNIDDNINILHPSNYENNKVASLQEELVNNNKELSNCEDLYKNNSLSKQMKSQDKSNFELSSNNKNSNFSNDINGVKDVDFRNSDNDNNFDTIGNNCSNNKINSEEQMLQNIKPSNHSDLQDLNNTAIGADNEYNVGNILNNYIKGKINSNTQISSMRRSYNLGKNITSKWDLPKKVNKHKNNKGEGSNAV